MTIPRMTVITLGVADLERATDFYRKIFSTPPLTQYEGVTFIPLPGVWLSLYPLEKLAEDIGQALTLPAANSFRGFALAYNARSKAEDKRDILPCGRRRCDDHQSPAGHLLGRPQRLFQRPRRQLLGSRLGADVRILRTR